MYNSIQLMPESKVSSLRAPPPPPTLPKSSCSSNLKVSEQQWEVDFPVSQGCFSGGRGGGSIVLNLTVIDDTTTESLGLQQGERENRRLILNKLPIPLSFAAPRPPTSVIRWR